MGRPIGIDLGTTHSLIATMQGSKPVIIPTAEGERLLPSVVAMSKTGERLVGSLAKRQATTNPENTIYSIKRLMGRRFKEPTVQFDMKRLPYRITEAPNGDCRVVMGDKEYSPPEISAMILQKLKTDAETYLGDRVADVVITVPAYFDHRQRRATNESAAIAGLNVMRIINEPTAACLAYGLDREKESIVAVCHLGGGTFDVSILEMGEGTFQVKSTSGDISLGGDDFDRRIMDWLCDEFREKHGIDLGQDRVAVQRLREAAETAKCELSEVLQTDIKLPCIGIRDGVHTDLTIWLTRAQLQKLVVDLIEKTLGPCRQALQDAGLSPEKLSEFVLVGRQTRMPAVQEAFREFFGKYPAGGVNPGEAVALGAAIEAGVLKGEVREVLLLDVTPLTLGIETLGGVATPLIPRNCTIPTSQSQIYSTAADNQTRIEVHVIQGEHPMAADNKTLGRFMLDGILPAPRGMPQIEVAFDIDANGILNVSARDKGTGKGMRVTIADYGMPSREEIVQERTPVRYAQENAQSAKPSTSHGVKTAAGDNTKLWESCTVDSSQTRQPKHKWWQFWR